MLPRYLIREKLSVEGGMGNRAGRVEGLNDSNLNEFIPGACQYKCLLPVSGHSLLFSDQFHFALFQVITGGTDPQFPFADLFSDEGGLQL